MTVSKVTPAPNLSEALPKHAPPVDMRGLAVYQVIAVTLLMGILGAHADEFPVPKAASESDNACASIAAYAQTHSGAQILPYIKSCGANPNKGICEATIELMKAADPARIYGLTCVGNH